MKTNLCALFVFQACACRSDGTKSVGSCKVKKKQITLTHKLSTRWHNVSKTLFTSLTLLRDVISRTEKITS